jgi:ArsR family transcriptional regulator
MAEAFVRELALPHITVQSAGFEVSMIHPLTRAVMAEQGIALAHQQAKTLAAIDEAPDVVISVCDYARRAVAQRWPTATYMHWSIPDPARHGTTQAFRVVRDTIKARVSATFMQESQP